MNPTTQVLGIAQNESGAVTIDGEVVADLVRQIHFRPASGIYLHREHSDTDMDLVPTERVDRWCGCALGLVAVKRTDGNPAAARQRLDRTQGLGNDLYIAALADSKAEARLLKGFEDGWCDFEARLRGATYREGVRLGKLAREQADEVYRHRDID